MSSDVKSTQCPSRRNKQSMSIETWPSVLKKRTKETPRVTRLRGDRVCMVHVQHARM